MAMSTNPSTEQKTVGEREKRINYSLKSRYKAVVQDKMFDTLEQKIFR